MLEFTTVVNDPSSKVEKLLYCWPFYTFFLFWVIRSIWSRFC